MIFEEIRVMRGPNMWSKKHHQVLAIKYNPLPDPKLAPKQLKKLGDYFRENYHIEPLNANVNFLKLNYIIKLAALLQGSDNFYNIVTPSPGIIYGIVEYKTEEAGVAAFHLAHSIIESIRADEEPTDLKTATEEVLNISREYNEGPTTTMIIEAAKKRNIPVSKGPAGYTILGHGVNQKRLSAAMSPYTTCIGVNIACNKEATKSFLKSAYIPVPEGKIAREEKDLPSIAEELGYPLVAKPLDGNHGRNITCNITCYETLLTGFRTANEVSKSVIIEKFIKGQDHRLLVVGNKFISASLRVPAFVVGDGYSSIQTLIDKENENPHRGEGHENILTMINVNATTELHLKKQGMSTVSVPALNEKVFLKQTANLSTGGTAIDVTDLVHPTTKKLVEKVSKVVDLDICGIDIISPDISRPLTENGGAVVEVNAAPGLRMHKYPSEGISRDVATPIVNLMFDEGNEGRIPIVAITGTNGKTTTTRLMAHIASSSGYTVGFSSTDGIYIGNEQISSGDCSGPQSAKTILQDPTVEFAVLECARGGIIRSGLGFDQCDIGIVTNVAADHLGLKDIHTVEDLALVKSVVPHAVKKYGWAILNAGDTLAYKMKETLECNVALFSSKADNKNILEHIERGGSAIYADHNQDIYLCHYGKQIFIFNAAELPITRNGKAGFMVDNILPVVLAAYFMGFKIDQIASSLKSFIPSAETTPGRINEFLINGVNVIVDYAHNPHGFKALSAYLKNIPGKKTGIITGTGDRREEDIIEFGRIAAATYDDIIIRFDRDLRGRTKESIVELLRQGLHEIKPQQKYHIIPDTQTAIYFAIANAEKGSYVVICADNATYTVGLTKNVALQFEKEKGETESLENRKINDIDNNLIEEII